MSFKHILKYDELNKYILKTDLRYKKNTYFLYWENNADL